MPLDPRDPLALARALIRRRTVTPADDGAMPWLASVLAGAGFETHLLPSGEGEARVLNLYACRGEAPFLAFAGHVDVVPPGDEAAWSRPPFGAEVAEGVLYGRGAVDMKGAVACMVAAALRAPAEGGPGLAFLLTGDEEGPAVHGTAALLAWMAARGRRVDHCLLGEPTSLHRLGDTLKVGRRGSLTGSLTAIGVQGHVAYPERARNPVDGLVAMLGALKAAPLDAGTADFAPSNLEVVDLHVGNPSPNVIPARASARFNIRFNDARTRDGLQTEIARRAAGTGVPHDLTFEPGNADAFLAPPGAFADLVAGAVDAELGLVPARSTSGGTSDARFIKDHCPVVELGLIGTSMHQVDERVPAAELEALTRVYGRVIAGYAAGVASQASAPSG